MLSQRSTLGLALVTLLVAASALWVSSDFDDRPLSGIDQPLFPELRSKLGEITVIHLQGPDGEATLVRTEDRWTIAERADYKADAAKVRTYLRAIARAQRKELKTSDPGKFERIGLGDSGARVELLDQDRDVLAALTVGSSVSRGSDGERWTFVLRDGEEASWLVDQLEDGSPDPVEWLDEEISDISPARFSSVEVIPASGARYSLTGGGPIPGEIFVADLHEGESASAPAQARATAMALAGLRLEDVSLRESVSGLPLTELVYRMADGLVVRAALSEDTAARRWLTLDASYDADRASNPDGPARMPDGPADGAGEAESLNADWGCWAYMISAIDADKLVRMRSDLVTTDSTAE